jgi:thiamine transport system substrate-binding protein
MCIKTTLSIIVRVALLCMALAVGATACGEDLETTAIGEGDAEAFAEENASDAPAVTEEDDASTCFDDPGLESITPGGDQAGTTITLATHDSFVLSDGTLAAFTDATGISVEQVAVGDAGQLVSQSILTKDNPTADVLFGIDNAFLCRGLEADLFVPYPSPALSDVDDELELDPYNRVTPISFGDVCVNYWNDGLAGPAPATLDDLADPVHADQFVTQNPETSSPGFAFLLATISEYGDDGWENYWESLVENGVSITSGWNDAYYGEFIAGGGDRSIVTSYASSPPAEFLFADPPVDTPPTAVLDDSCFRQIEFAGVLAGTEHPEAAAALIDFMLGITYQEDVPLNMFVYPANGQAALPESFVDFGPLVDDARTIDPAVIETNRDDWTERWNNIVLG